MIEERFENCMLNLCRQLVACPAIWAFTGSLSMVLQGMTLPIHDIDIQTTREGAWWIDEKLAYYCVQAVYWWESPMMKSWFGNYSMDDIRVEIMGDIMKSDKQGDFYPTPPLDTLVKFVENGTIRIPVMNLAYEERAYRQMGRIEKADKIATFLHGKENDLLGEKI